MRTLSLTFAFCALLVAGCGGGTSTTSTPDLVMVSAGDMAMAAADMAGMAPADMAKGTPVMVGMGGLNFNPAMVTIKVGETVTWTWASSGHTVTSGVPGAPDNKFCSPGDMSCAMAAPSVAGFVYSHTFTAAGMYPYYCIPHMGANMKGAVVVQ